MSIGLDRTSRGLTLRVEVQKDGLGQETREQNSAVMKLEHLGRQFRSKRCRMDDHLADASFAPYEYEGIALADLMVTPRVCPFHLRDETLPVEEY